MEAQATQFEHGYKTFGDATDAELCRIVAKHGVDGWNPGGAATALACLRQRDETSLVDLRAQRAEREEDYRIAREHRNEAAARDWSPANQAAYESARDWAGYCWERLCDARGRDIRATAAL